MGREWRDCIVTMIDLVGIKKSAQLGTTGSSLMRRLHNLVVQELKIGLPSVAHAYTWNDSVLLLSYLDTENSSFEAALRDADKLKMRIDCLRPSYAIAVKGQTFPQIHQSATVSQTPRFTIIEASSWAMANCFEIEKSIEKLRKPWYVDGRIAGRIRTNQKFLKEKVGLFPSRARRNVYVYDGYLWEE